MESVVLIIGFIIFLIGAIMFFIVAFRESLGWGLGCVIFKPVALIFLIMHWNKAKIPFFIELSGLILIFLGAVSGGHP